MEEKNKKEEKHYICLGGCRGLSNIPGTCNDIRCPYHNKELTECNCTDGLHYDFKLKNN